MRILIITFKHLDGLVVNTFMWWSLKSKS